MSTLLLPRLLKALIIDTSTPVSFLTKESNTNPCYDYLQIESLSRERNVFMLKMISFDGSYYTFLG